MSKIDTLTSEQEEDLAGYIKECLAIGRSCEPADRPVAEAAIKKMYSYIGENEPYIWWCDGPATGSILRTLIANSLDTVLDTNRSALGVKDPDSSDNLVIGLRDSLRSDLHINFWNSVRADFWANLSPNLTLSLRSDFRDDPHRDLWKDFGSNFRHNLITSLGDNLRDDIKENFKDRFHSKLWDDFRASLWNNFGINLENSLGDVLHSKLWDGFRADFWDSLSTTLGFSLRKNFQIGSRSNLWNDFGVSLRDNLRGNLGDNLRDDINENLRADFVVRSAWDFLGQHELSWQAFFDWPDRFVKKIYSEKDREKLDTWMNISKSCGWWEPYKKIVFVCERPSRQAVDEQGRLHHATEAALICRDGWEVYAWHNVRVPKLVITNPELITIEMINKEENAEIRRVMIERFGEVKYIEQSRMTPVSHDDKFGTIYLNKFDSGRPICRLRVVNRSPEPDQSYRTYWLAINPDHYNGDAGRVPQAASASTWRTTPGGTELLFKNYKDYNPQIET